MISHAFCAQFSIPFLENGEFEIFFFLEGEEGKKTRKMETAVIEPTSVFESNWYHHFCFEPPTEWNDHAIQLAGIWLSGDENNESKHFFLHYRNFDLDICDVPLEENLISFFSAPVVVMHETETKHFTFKVRSPKEISSMRAHLQWIYIDEDPPEAASFTLFSRRIYVDAASVVNLKALNKLDTLYIKIPTLSEENIAFNWRGPQVNDDITESPEYDFFSIDTVRLVGPKKQTELTVYNIFTPIHLSYYFASITIFAAS